MLRPLVVDVAKRPLLAVKCTMNTDLKVPYYTHFRSLFFPSSGLVGEPCTEGKNINSIDLQPDRVGSALCDRATAGLAFVSFQTCGSNKNKSVRFNRMLKLIVFAGGCKQRAEDLCFLI